MPTATPEAAAPPREAPPASATPRDVSFPPVVRATVARGLETNVVEARELPIVYLQLVVKSEDTSVRFSHPAGWPVPRLWESGSQKTLKP